MYAHSISDPDGFWGEHGKRIDWFKPYTKVKDTSCDPHNVSIKWYRGRRHQRRLQLRRPASAQARQPDRDHLGGRRSRRVASTSPIAELHDEVCRFANVLKAIGVKKGDRVTIYLPMIPEAAYAMLACARIGAIHSVVFGGFSPDALAGRIEDASRDDRDHRRRGPARRPQGAAQGQRRRRARRRRRRVKTRHRRQAHRRRRSTWSAGRDVWLHEAVRDGLRRIARPSR